MGIDTPRCIVLLLLIAALAVHQADKQHNRAAEATSDAEGRSGWRTEPEMMHSALQGRHETSDGQAMTLQDLYEMLKRLPRKARDNYFSVTAEDGKQAEIHGLSFGQSDQADKWEFSVHLITKEWY